MLRFFAFLALLPLLVSCLVSMSPPLLPRPAGEIGKADAIETYLEGRELDPVEGVWVWGNNNYELLITSNDFGLRQDYDYLGIVLNTRNHNWRPGELKLLLKKTAVGWYMVDLYLANKEMVTTRASVTHEGVLKIEPPRGRTLGFGDLLLLRTYPVELSQPPPQRPPSPSPDGSEVTLHSAGSGFFVAEGIVATNYHVVKGATRIEVAWGQRNCQSTLAVKDRFNDLALLEVVAEGSLPPPLPLGHVREIGEGDAVFTVGFPLSDELGIRPRVADGIVSSVTGLEDDPRVCQITVPIQPGNSGGPLLNNRGAVIGVVTASLNELYFLAKNRAIPQNVNFAIKINYVHNLLQLLPRPVEAEFGGSNGTMDATGVMAVSRPSVVRVMNYR
ncbi:S1C family serine protease [Candidatus Latescibacterota bacterium]